MVRSWNAPAPASRHAAVDRPPLDLDVLLVEPDLLLHRRFDNIAAYSHAATADLALADPQLLLINRDDFFPPPYRHIARGERRGIPCRRRIGAGCVLAGPPGLTPLLRMGFDV
jgi:hypothetical protein